MLLEEIQNNWFQDCRVDQTDLGNAAAKIPELHQKYYKIYSQERLLLKKYETDYKKLRLEKFEFYTQGPTKETHEKGWELPPVGKILKSEVNTYLDADDDIVNMLLKMALQEEKVKFLESIIQNSINNRSFIIKNILDWRKFINGE
jgi:hypothetical protein